MVDMRLIHRGAMSDKIKIKIRSETVQNQMERGNMMIRGYVHFEAVNVKGKFKKGGKESCVLKLKKTKSRLQIAHGEQE